MYRSDLNSRDKGGAIAAVIAIHAGLIFAFLHLNGTIDLADPQDALQVFDLREEAPPPPPPPPPRQERRQDKPKDKEGGSPANIRSQATPAVAPKPITDDFLKLLNDSFGRSWRNPRRWPWSRLMWAYGFTLVGVTLTAGAVSTMWAAVSESHRAKPPVVNVETSETFRLSP